MFPSLSTRQSTFSTHYPPPKKTAIKYVDPHLPLIHTPPAIDKEAQMTQLTTGNRRHIHAHAVNQKHNDIFLRLSESESEICDMRYAICAPVIWIWIWAGCGPVPRDTVGSVVSCPSIELLFEGTPERPPSSSRLGVSIATIGQIRAYVRFDREREGRVFTACRLQCASPDHAVICPSG